MYLYMHHSNVSRLLLFSFDSYSGLVGFKTTILSHSPHIRMRVASSLIFDVANHISRVMCIECSSPTSCGHWGPYWKPEDSILCSHSSFDTEVLPVGLFLCQHILMLRGEGRGERIMGRGRCIVIRLPCPLSRLSICLFVYASMVKWIPPCWVFGGVRVELLHVYWCVRLHALSLEDWRCYFSRHGI